MKHACRHLPPLLLVVLVAAFFVSAPGRGRAEVRTYVREISLPGVDAAVDPDRYVSEEVRAKIGILDEAGERLLDDALIEASGLDAGSVFAIAERLLRFDVAYATLHDAENTAVMTVSGRLDTASLRREIVAMLTSKRLPVPESLAQAAAVLASAPPVQTFASPQPAPAPASVVSSSAPVSPPAPDLTAERARVVDKVKELAETLTRREQEQEAQTSATPRAEAPQAAAPSAPLAANQEALARVAKQHERAMELASDAAARRVAAKDNAAVRAEMVGEVREMAAALVRRPSPALTLQAPAASSAPPDDIAQADLAPPAEPEEPLPLPTKRVEADKINPMFDAHYKRGLEHARYGQWQEAVASYNTALMLNPCNATVYATRGRTLLERGKFAEAVRDYSSALDYEIDPQWFVQRGRANAGLGEYDAAERDFSFAVRMDPGNAKAFVYRALVRQAMGRTQDMCRDYEKADGLGDHAGLAWARGKGLCP